MSELNKYKVLSDYFGYKQFREGQEKVIDSILGGMDTLGIMPTGAGKSICYQVPGLILNGITLVISPLVSLMKDQVRSLNELGIHAAYLNSSLSYNQYNLALRYAKEGRYKIIYVAPERLSSEEFIEFAQNVNISMVSVDEAHCVSQWGQNFRPSYLKIIEFVDKLPIRPIVSAFTATATYQVKEDIIYMLRLRNPTVLSTGFNRKNLHYIVRKPKDKYSETIKILAENLGKSGIIYCQTRKTVDEVCEKLYKAEFPVVSYHAGLSDIERRQNQDEFIYDRKPIIVATNAFGMGIDKPSVNFVIHYNMPKDIESYYQEAGRAGRDGERAECILLYGGKDVVTNQYFIDNNRENEELDEASMKLIRERDSERLKKMTFYCFTNECLRDYMLRYFGEYGSNYCGNCSNCLTNFEEVDVTEQAKAMAGCIQECHGRFGINVILDTLKGSKTVRIKQCRMDQNSHYGRLTGVKDHFLRLVVNHLLIFDYLNLTNDEYPVLKLTEKSQVILDGTQQVIMKIAKEEEHKSKDYKREDAKAGRKETSYGVDPNLFDALRDLRKDLAAQAKVPPYIIFNDRTLRDMCDKRPVDRESMLLVSGVGEVKYNRYGEQFLQVVLKHLPFCQEI